MFEDETMEDKLHTDMVVYLGENEKTRLRQVPVSDFYDLSKWLIERGWKKFPGKAKMRKEYIEVLELWEILSLLDDIQLSYEQRKNQGEIFKNEVMTEILGFGRGRKNGCPLCEAVEKCEDCIIYRCTITSPFFRWERHMAAGYHSRKEAKKFYKYLLKKINDTRRKKHGRHS
jgi:hypothetical protein